MAKAKEAVSSAGELTQQYEARYELRIQGVSGLVMNKPNLIGGREDKGRDPAKWEQEHFLEKCYRNSLNELIIPGRAIKKALMDACRFIPEKPRGVAFKSFLPFIQSATIITDDAVLDVSEAQVMPLTLVVNLDPSKGNKGPRGPRTRPMIPVPWQASTRIIVFDPIITAARSRALPIPPASCVGFSMGARLISGGRW